jgi:stearoyl-CoA desaturase (delta-9 desaturase)
MLRSGSRDDADIYSLPRRDGINFATSLVLVIFHIGAVAALFNFTWSRFWAAVFLYWVATGLGISMGYHRLHTHRGYKCPVWLEYFFALCGTLSLEGGPIFWVAVHRIHHQKSDQPGDPHSPRDGGFYWSHIGWLLVGASNNSNTRLMSKYSPDLAKHRFYVVLNNWHWMPQVILAGILLAIGGFPLMLWGIFLRVTFGLHATWLVNSATHLWGRRRFATRDDSRNNWLVALITFGEGWHNNHHAHPTSIRHGLAWYEVDHSWILVNLLKRVGLVWDLKVAKMDHQVVPEREAA